MQILEVSPDQSGSGGFRVHGSMRVVDQDSGQDLDPTGQMAAARGPGMGFQGTRKYACWVVVNVASYDCCNGMGV